MSVEIDGVSSESSNLKRHILILFSKNKVSGSVPILSAVVYIDSGTI